jgi:hypothetical protein
VLFPVEGRLRGKAILDPEFEDLPERAADPNPWDDRRMRKGPFRKAPPLLQCQTSAQTQEGLEFSHKGRGKRTFEEQEAGIALFLILAFSLIPFVDPRSVRGTKKELKADPISPESPESEPWTDQRIAGMKGKGAPKLRSPEATFVPILSGKSGTDQ